jgi:hypothetical protein
MTLKDIIAITGVGGLFKLESQRGDGVIVKELGQDNARFVPTRTHDITPLENITIYDDADGVVLTDVFIEMKKQEAATPVPDAKAEESVLRGYLERILPKYDREKVYASDIRKLVRWYHLLDRQKLVDTEKPEKKEPEVAAKPAPETKAAESETPEESPAAKKAKKPAAKGKPAKSK